MRYLKIRSKNPTAAGLRKQILSRGRNIVFRLGSLTPIERIFPRLRGEEVYTINSIEAIQISNNKASMKDAFAREAVKTADWSRLNEIEDWDVFPAIIKHVNSSKGKGIFYIENPEDLASFIEENPRTERYIIEKYYSFSKEYRLHTTKDGCFYTCRKMLRQDAEDRWHRHDNNSVWILEENPLFEKPSNWEDIVNECKKAIISIGLDVAAIDIKVQTEKGKKEGFVPDFIILETNSAPSLGEVTTEKYIVQLQKMCDGIN